MNALTVVKTLPKVLTHGGNKAIFALKKVKPQLLVGTGAVVVIGSFVWAVVNARKMNDAIMESQEKVDDIQQKIDTVQANVGEELTPIEQKNKLMVLNKELRNAKMESVWRMFLLIGLPSLTFAGGMCIAIGGHLLLLRRFGEVSAAFATLQETFNRYRQMNIAEHGEECDRRYRYGIVGETEMETTYTDENGEEKKAICTVPIVDKNAAASMYTFEFSEHTSYKCPRDPVNMISFLQSQQKYWNIWMESTGKAVTLAMVLNDLAIYVDPNDPANDYLLVAGWRPNGDGDNHIDFGIMRAVNKPAIDRLENVCILNFNCDGNIYHSTRYSKDGKKIC